MTAVLTEPVTTGGDLAEDPEHYYCVACYPDGESQFSFCGVDVTDDPVVDAPPTDEDCIFCQAVEAFYDGCPGCFQ